MAISGSQLVGVLHSDLVFLTGMFGFWFFFWVVHAVSSYHFELGLYSAIFVISSCFISFFLFGCRVIIVIPLDVMLMHT